MEKQNQSPQTPNNGTMTPHVVIIQGVLAVIIGIIFLLKAHAILIDVLYCMAGLACIYYGMVVLHVDNVISGVWASIKRLVQSIRG